MITRTAENSIQVKRNTCDAALLVVGKLFPTQDGFASGSFTLQSDPGERFRMVVTNLALGKKSGNAVVNGKGDLENEDIACERQDSWTTTKNKQLDFVQHIKTLLKINGRGAAVLTGKVLLA